MNMNVHVQAVGQRAAAGALHALCRPAVARSGRIARSTITIRDSATGQEQVWRPSIDDVQRISSGDSAKVRGTGSRDVPHRLNADERKLYDLATKQKGFLTLSGSGYRRERKGSPLANIWRQWCDAKALPCVLVAKGTAGDTVLVDYSTLRLADTSKHREACRAIAAEMGVAPQPEGSQPSPFTVILPLPLVNVLMEGGSIPGSGNTSSSSSGEDTASSTQKVPSVSSAAATVEDAQPSGADSDGADGLPAESSSGGEATHSDGDDGSGSSSSAVEQILADLRCSAPIWQHPPQLECFTADRNTAKTLAKALADGLKKL